MSDNNIVNTVYNQLEADGILDPMKTLLKAHVCKVLAKPHSSRDLENIDSKKFIVSSVKDMLQYLNFSSTLVAFEKELEANFMKEVSHFEKPNSQPVREQGSLLKDKKFGLHAPAASALPPVKTWPKHDLHDSPREDNSSPKASKIPIDIPARHSPGKPPSPVQESPHRGSPLSQPKPGNANKYSPRSEKSASESQVDSISESVEFELEEEDVNSASEASSSSSSEEAKASSPVVRRSVLSDTQKTSPLSKQVVVSGGDGPEVNDDEKNSADVTVNRLTGATISRSKFGWNRQDDNTSNRDDDLDEFLQESGDLDKSDSNLSFSNSQRSTGSAPRSKANTQATPSSPFGVLGSSDAKSSSFNQQRSPALDASASFAESSVDVLSEADPNSPVRGGKAVPAVAAKKTQSDDEYDFSIEEDTAINSSYRSNQDEDQEIRSPVKKSGESAETDDYAEEFEDDEDSEAADYEKLDSIERKIAEFEANDKSGSLSRVKQAFVAKEEEKPKPKPIAQETEQEDEYDDFEIEEEIDESIASDNDDLAQLNASEVTSRNVSTISKTKIVTEKHHQSDSEEELSLSVGDNTDDEDGNDIKAKANDRHNFKSYLEDSVDSNHDLEDSMDDVMGGKGGGFYSNNRKSDSNGNAIVYARTGKKGVEVEVEEEISLTNSETLDSSNVSVDYVTSAKKNTRNKAW